MHSVLYNILFAAGIVSASYYVWYYWRRYIGSERSFELFLILEIVGIFLGARLCHCLCYEPHYFLRHPIEMFLPVATMPDGKTVFTGFYGLASHGGTAGAIIAAAVYGKIKHQSILKILDLAAIATPLLGAFIRIGNFFNQEIIGLPTSLPWGVVFSKVDSLPRHPAQLYEAIFYALLFGFSAAVFHIHRYGKANPLIYFGFNLAAISTFRFFIEFIKENQTEIESDMTLNMGQWLSLPLIILGLSIVALKASVRYKKIK